MYFLTEISNQVWTSPSPAHTHCEGNENRETLVVSELQNVLEAWLMSSEGSHSWPSTQNVLHLEGPPRAVRIAEEAPMAGSLSKAKLDSWCWEQYAVDGGELVRRWRINSLSACVAMETGVREAIAQAKEPWSMPLTCVDQWPVEKAFSHPGPFSKACLCLPCAHSTPRRFLKRRLHLFVTFGYFAYICNYKGTAIYIVFIFM